MSDPTGIPRNEVGEPARWTVLHVAETGSTNTDLVTAAEAGTAADRTVLRADHQTAGRGRLDRRWDAPPGANLLASILFLRPPAMPAVLTQAVGLAAVDAVEELAGNDLRSRLGLKWPNDVLLDDSKLSGVLAQRSVATGAVVVGLGLNVAWSPAGSVSLRENLGLSVTPHRLLEVLLESLDRLLATDIATRYRERLLTLGAHVRVELPGDHFVTGVAVDVEPDGRLVVDSGDERRTLDVGDVVHLRPV